MKPTSEVILLFHFTDKEMLTKIKYTLVRLNMRMKVVEYKDYNKSIGYHIGIPMPGPIEESKMEDYKGADMEAPMMILKGLTNNRIDQLLASLYKAGVPKIPYKAVVTEHNVHWNAMNLYEEIAKEHAKMQALEQQQK